MPSKKSRKGRKTLGLKDMPPRPKGGQLLVQGGFAKLASDYVTSAKSTYSSGAGNVW